MRHHLLTPAQKRILSALVKCNGNVAQAASLKGVTKQYVYEVIKKLREKGVTFHAEPIYSALGLELVLCIRERTAPLKNKEYIIWNAELLHFACGVKELCIYAFPIENVNMLIGDLYAQCVNIHRLYDMHQSAGEASLHHFMDILKTSNSESHSVDRSTKHRIDKIDILIINELMKDFFTPLRKIAEKTGISENTISYHYRMHVKNIVRFRYHCPISRWLFFLNFSRLESLYNVLLKGAFVNYVFKVKEKDEIFTILDLSADELSQLIKALLRASKGLEVKVIGMLNYQSILRKPLPVSKFINGAWIV